MLSSIHPLGERGRHNRWWLTVGAFTLGAVLAGSSVGAVLGLVGRVALGSITEADSLIAIAAVTLVAGILDMVRAVPPGPERQVNETWIGAYRGWVYGGGFGLQLGAGFLTYIVTWGVFAMFLAELLTASPAAGAVIGAVFGLGRSSTLVIAVFVDRPSRLTSFNGRLAAVGPGVRRVAPAGLMAIGAVTVAAGVL
jgi:sulfite exporter TauE/SafE